MLLNQLSNHIAEDRTDCVETLIGRTDVVETIVVEQNLLNNENRDRLAELAARLHNTQAQRDDLRRKEEVDNFARVVLHQCANNTQRSESEIFERSRLGRRVEERVEEEGDMSYARCQL